MYSKQDLIPNSIKHVFVVFILLLLSIKVYSNETSSLPKLTLTPNQCISLHKNQQCFVTVDISWQVSNAGKYCLYSSVQKKQLHCWTMKNRGYFTQKLVIESDITFTLKSMGDGLNHDKLVASEILELAWVHKSRRAHASWRVF